MFNYTKILLLSFALVAFFSAHTCVQDSNTSVEYIVPPKVESKKPSKLSTHDENSFDKCSKITRGVLITFCGSCHQSTLDSHKADAIKVFDLDLGVNWHTSLSQENLEGIARRTQNKDITEHEKEAITAFLKTKDLQLKQ